MITNVDLRSFTSKSADFWKFKMPHYAADGKANLKLIIANRNYSSWSLRPWLLMKMLDIAFTERVEPFHEVSNYETFREFSPTGQVPVLIDGERTVWDSLGIVMYLADRVPGVWPQEQAARAWAICAVCEMHGGFGALRNDCTMNVGVRVTLKPASPALRRDLARLGELWTEGIEQFGGPWLAGPQFTAADAFYAPIAFRVRTYGLDIGSAGATWVERMLNLPAMREWEAAALAEWWREPQHEVELSAAGTLIQDNRAQHN